MLNRHQSPNVKGGFYEQRNNTVTVIVLLFLFSRRHHACRVRVEMVEHVSRSMTERIIDAYVQLRMLLEKIAKIVSSMKA